MKYSLAAHTPYATVSKAAVLEMMQLVYNKLFGEEQQAARGLFRRQTAPMVFFSVQAGLKLVVPLHCRNAMVLVEAN